MNTVKLTNNTYAAREAATATLFGNYFGMSDCYDILSKASKFLNDHFTENDPETSELAICLKQMADQFGND